MPLNKIYQLRHIQHQDNQNIENVYFFNHVTGDGLSTDLALDFEGEWLNDIRALQVNTMHTDGISVYNMGDLSDFANLPLASPGTFATDESLPSFAAIGYTLKLNTRAVRPGSKRIAGIPEIVTNRQTITDAAYIALMEAFRLKLQAPLVGASDTWQLVVVKRVKTPVVGTVPLQYDYRMPTTDADLVYGSVVAALTSTTISSQVSRKA